MSTEIAYLALRLEGPLQAWGYDSQFNRRNTGLFPTKSAILGMCCAAMGISRGSEREQAVLAQLRSLRLLTVALPIMNYRMGDHEAALQVRRLIDYHTVQNTRTAVGGMKDTHLTWRQYLCDASFVAVVKGEREIIVELAKALRNPKWGVWLGRKACIPTAPICRGNKKDVFDTEEDALYVLLNGQPLDAFSHQREVERFEDGTDTFSDQPVCFGGSKSSRAFNPRRVRLVEGKL